MGRVNLLPRRRRVAPSIDISEEDGVRYLHFGSHWVQGAMRIARPWALELDYTRDMMVPLLFRMSRWPRSALLIGLGAASMTKFLYRHRPRCALTVVEIDAAVVRAAENFFKLPVDPPRLAIEIGDGHDYVAASTRGFDLILVDGYDAKSRVGMLDTLPFYLNCRARLTARGVLATNFLNARRGLAASLARIDAAFDGRAIALPQCSSGNIIAMAAAGEPVSLPMSELKTCARRLQRDTGLNLAPTIARLETLQVPGDERFEL